DETRRRQQGPRWFGGLGGFLRRGRALLAFGDRCLGEDVAARQRDVALAREPLDELPRGDLFNRAGCALGVDAETLAERRGFLAGSAEQFSDFVDPDCGQRLLLRCFCW